MSKRGNFRAWCVECPDRELILANVQYDHVLEMLQCIHPTYKEVDDQSVHILLPLAFDYQARVWVELLHFLKLLWSKMVVDCFQLKSHSLQIFRASLEKKLHG